MDCLLGIDVGTTAVKCLLMAAAGDVLFEGACSYSLLSVGERGYEQEPDELWQAMVTCCRQMLAEAPHAKVLALALSTQGGTTLLLDRSGKPLGRAVSWMDRRGEAYVPHVTKQIPAETVYSLTGWTLSGALPLMHLVRISCEEPGRWQQAARTAFIQDYFHGLLVGRYVTDPSNAAITQLFNVSNCSYASSLLALAGQTASSVPAVQPPGSVLGRLTRTAQTELGLGRDTLVVNGAHDQYCAALGAGVVQPGQMLLSTGTAWVILTLFSSAVEAFRTGLSISEGPTAGLYGALTSLGGVGQSLAWFSDSVLGSLEQDEPYAWLEEHVPASPPGAGGLVFADPVHSSRAGDLAGFLGLRFEHTLADMARSIMESTVYQAALAVEAMRTAGLQPTKLTMVGRPAESRVWPQMVADVLGLPVGLPCCSQAPALGAALLAGVGAGVYPDWSRLPERGGVRVLEPRRPQWDAYQAGLERYRRVTNAARRC